MSLVISFVLKLKGDEGSIEMVYGHVLPLSLLWKYTGKWGRTWREIDECGGRWNGQDDFLILYIFSCFV